MAFQNTRERYASFGVATSIPPEIIDTFWQIIDENLKGVFSLEDILLFALVKNNKNNLSIEYHDKKKTYSSFLTMLILLILFYHSMSMLLTMMVLKQSS